MFEIKLFKRGHDGNKSALAGKAKYRSKDEADAAYRVMRRLSVGHCVVPCFSIEKGRRVINDNFEVEGLKMSRNNAYIVERPIYI